jgi:hypothetical protein
MCSVHFIMYPHFYLVGRDCIVGIVTCRGLDGPGIETPVGARCSALIQTGLGAVPDAYTLATRLFLGMKQLGRGVNHTYPPIQQQG